MEMIELIFVVASVFGGVYILFDALRDRAAR